MTPYRVRRERGDFEPKNVKKAAEKQAAKDAKAAEASQADASE